MMSTPNLRRSKREVVARKHSSGPSNVAQGKAGIHESQCKSPQGTKDHSAKVEGNRKNTSAPKRLDARGYRQAVKERFNLKGLNKENGGADKTKNQSSDSLAAVDGKTEIKGSCQTGAHIALQVESKDGRPNDEEQWTESEPGDSRQSNCFTRLEKSLEKGENSCSSRKRKQAELELQQDFSVSGTRSGKIYKCEVPESSDGKIIEEDIDGEEKEGSLLDDSGMDLFVSMPIGDKIEMHEEDMTEKRYSGECMQCIDCQKWQRPGNIRAPRDLWRCNDCNALHAPCSVSQEKSKHSLIESCALVDDPVSSFGHFEGNKPSANTCMDLEDGQDSGGEDSKSDENSMSNDTGPKKLVWAEIQKGRWWPAFTVVQSDQWQQNSLSLNKGSELAHLIYSDDLRKESKVVEARSVRPFWENYEELKNIHNNKGFLDAVSKAYKLYQDCLLKGNHLESPGQVEKPGSPLHKDKAIGKSDTDGVAPANGNHLESPGQVEKPGSPLHKDKAIGKSDTDGVAPANVAQKRLKQLSKGVSCPGTHRAFVEECEVESSMELRSTNAGNLIEIGEDLNVDLPSPAQMSGSGVKSSSDFNVNSCQVCKEGGELLRCCDGRDCHMTYHLHCLEPSLVRVPPGDWYCPTCAYKRVSHGVHSVCKGIESIWKMKEIDTEQNEHGKVIEGDLAMGRKTRHSFGKEHGGRHSSCSVSALDQREDDRNKEKLSCDSMTVGQDEVPNKNMNKMNLKKQYFVKYKGLSHLHNQWVNEKLLIDEEPKKLANYKKKLKEGKAPKWNPEWAEPHRLIQRRSLICANYPVEERGGASLDRCVEWCVKWKGLGYDKCTWELESTGILSSTSAKELMKAFEIRLEEARHRASTQRAVKAKKLRNSGFSRLKKLPDWMKGGQECPTHLKCVNKLREFWQNHKNALLIDEVNQERIVMTTSFILSLIKEFDITRPVLIVTSIAGLSVWESEILQWGPSVNMVVYCGNRDARDAIQKLEFFDESGCVMVQIVLSTTDIVSADLDILKPIEWEVLIIDECQHSKFSKVIPQLEQLPVEFRFVLFNEQMKDNAAEISHLLSFLDSGNEYAPEDISEHQHQDGSEYLASLKSKLLEYIALERKSDSLSSANFIEYWVPVELANVQVEQYCTILMMNGDSLCSMLKKNDPEPLRDLLLSLRKCCIHPYLVDVSLQSSLRQGLQEVDFLDIDINASSKLQLLDNILSELRSKGQRVLILFQMIGRSGGISIGDILDDHIRQRFGVDSYERVDGGLPSTKKHAALQMFNSKDSGRFVFLLEKRACGTSIKLSSIDTVIIFDSDWNPLNDLRALQKVHIDAHVEHLKVFRFYSPYTLEERVLISAKQDYVLDNHLENLSATVCQMLLKWGTSHLFKRYDELHDSNSHNLISTPGYDNKNLKSLAKDILACALDGFRINNSLDNSVIQRVPRSGGYGKGVQMLGESENQLKEEKMLSNAFWAKLLKGRHIEKHGATGQLQRTRRKVQYSERSPSKLVSDPDELEARKKRRRVTETVDPISITSWLKDKKKSLASGKETNENSIETHTDGANQVCNESIRYNSGKHSHLMGKKSPAGMLSSKYPSPSSGSCDADIEIHGSDYENVNDKSSLATKAAIRVEEQEDGKALRLAQQCLHSRIKPELVKLCKILQLPDGVTSMTEEFLSYVMNNYRLPKEPTSLLQAVEISLCCAAAGCLKYEMDLDASIELAKSQLKFECKRAEIDSVYLKLREQCLKLRGDIPCTAGQCGSRVTPSRLNSASQHRAGEMHSQDEQLSTLRDDSHTKSSIQMGAIQESFNVHDSPGIHDNDESVNTERRDELGSQYQIGLYLPEQETLETIVTPNTQPVEDDLNHLGENIETCVTNQQEFTLLDTMGVADTFSSPGTSIPSNCQLSFLSSEKIKIIKEKLHARKQALLRRQQAEVKEFFRRRENEGKNIEARHSMGCHKIKSMYQNPEVREAKLKEIKIRHAEMVGLLKEHFRKALHDLKNRQSALREKENKIFVTCLEDINAGRISKFLSGLMESSSIREVSEPVAQNTTSEACEPIDSTLPSAAGTGRSISMLTSEQQQDKASLSESCMAMASSQSPEFQENQLVNGQTTPLMSDMPQNETDNMLETCRPSSSLERNSSGLCNHVPSQADTAKPSQDSQMQQHLNQHLSLQLDSTVSSEQCHQASEPENQSMPSMSRSQTEHVDNILSLAPSFVPTMEIESSQPLQETEVVERSGSATETLTMAGSLPRGNESFHGMQYANPGAIPMQFRIPASARAQQTNFSDPLYHETLKIRKEIERNNKLHEEETIRIQGEFARELEDMKRRYSGLLQEKECEFALKKRILETNLIKVDKNRRLAEAFKIKDNNAAVSSVHSGSAIHSQQSRPQTIPVSTVRLSQLATPVVHSGSPVLVSDLSTSCSLPSASGIQGGGMLYLPNGNQSNDAWAPGLQFPARMFSPSTSLQNTQLGQGAQSSSLPHNFGVVSDMINRNAGLSGCSGSVNSGGLSTQARQLQAQGNFGEIMSHVYLSEANSIISQRLQQQEPGNLPGSPNPISSPGSSLSGFMPMQQSQTNFHNQISAANSNRANALRAGANIIESGTQDTFVSGDVELLVPLQGHSAASQVERIDIPQVSSSSLQEINNNTIVEYLYATDIQHPTQANVLLEDSGNVGATLVYSNDASDAPILTRRPTCGLESEVSPSPLLVQVQPNCNNMAPHSINAHSVICLSDDD